MGETEPEEPQQPADEEPTAAQGTQPQPQPKQPPDQGGDDDGTFKPDNRYDG